MPRASNPTKFTRAVALKNAKRVFCLEQIALRPDPAFTGEDLAKLTRQSLSAGHAMTRAFVEAGLVELILPLKTNCLGKGIRGSVSVFRLKEDAVENAKKLWPTLWDGQEVLPFDSTLASSRIDPAVPRTVVKIKRDPLVIMLMGEGRAPSLNFIDSKHGVQDAESQTAIQANR